MSATDPFEAAVDAIVNGDEAALQSLLAANPGLIQARSDRPHHATLLHYIAANGVEDERQTTPPNAVAITRILLEAGADPNATIFVYGADYSTLGLLVSSVHPHRAGLQTALANLLLDRGADGKGAILTALAFGYGDTAKDLARRVPIDSLPVASGLGDLPAFDQLLNHASSEDRHQAVAVAAMHGQVAVLERLAAAGEDLSRLNPEGFHSHSTPLHQAAFANQLDTVRWLVEHGARTDIRDTMWNGTPLGWAEHGGHDAVAQYLRHAAPHF